ncbi:helix-turn-helix domain-containing protein [Streptomyces sp. NPDC006704]|uniref:helix-turn-helix domain-containing protein n=1 Tax=Streptomyces sp. NPDC006704 TaxID=3364760 RepID=UPI0036BD4698
MPISDSSDSGQPTITRILCNARARRDPRDIPGFDALLGRRNRPGLSQAETARLCNVSRRWYGALERGEPENYSDAFLGAVRRILNLDETEWDLVYRLTRHRTPPPSLTSPSGSRRTEVPEAVRMFLDGLPWPAYLCSHRWDVLAYNAKMADDFPWLLHGVNAMMWALTYPEARTQLIDWENGWAVPMVAQLRFHVEQWKHDEGMRAVLDAVLMDPDARRLWNSSDLPTLSHPDSALPRRLYLPRQGTKEFSVVLLTLTPDAMSTCRLMVLIPV